MTKKDLIEAIHGHLGDEINKRQIDDVLEAIGTAVTNALAKGDEVPLPGLGKLTVKERAARQGRNPQTGEAITIPAGKKVHFAPAKALKDAV
ncbi:HU family DNA-binding protein [Methylogaea oryzae]|uniref:DNA-binding protein HU-beta n=1 Tax=Methylogaea oryzae TaxID=1295382 RepID=A0A8D4VMM2_9GAMM|nr:HU family DNA-binding protein [Methylogaea oryzae]BBL70356.1 DNA-binding protein HU-beta [Methylogaea oryzae]